MAGAKREEAEPRVIAREDHLRRGHSGFHNVLIRVPSPEHAAGCAIETKTGEVYSGRNVENAAYNPGLTPLQSAILCMITATVDNTPAIHRVVLVEKPTAVRQRKAVQLLLETWAPEIDLEYYEATQ